MRTLWIRYGLVFLGALLILSQTACTSTPVSGNAKGQTVRFSEVIHSIFYAPHYVAMGKGFFKGEGINVDMVTSQGSDKGAAALLAGTADISLVGPETSIFIFKQQSEKTLKVFYQLTGTDGSVLMARKKDTAFTWSSLKGKTIIGWRKGSAPDNVLNSLVQKSGVSGVNVVNSLAPQAMVGAFESGKGDYIQAYEPVASTLEKEGKAFTVASFALEIGTFPETSYEATSDYISAHPDVLQKWSNAVYKATQWIQTHSSEEVANVLQPYFSETPKDLIVSSVERYKQLKVWPESPVPTYQQLSILQQVLIENGLLKSGEKIRYENVVDRRFTDQVVKGGK